MLGRGLIVCTLGFTHAHETQDGLVLIQAKAAVISGGKTESNAGPLRMRYNNKCMDYDHGNDNNKNNVYMHPCHGQPNQQWFMENELLKTNHDGKCLDVHTGNDNVYMHECHGNSNQQWFFDGEALKTRHDTTKCLDYDLNTDNIYMHACHTGRNQDFYWARPANPAYASRVKSRHGDKCMDYDYNNDNIYFHTCHDGRNQKFYLDGTDLKSIYTDKCVDYDFNNQNVYMFSCHGKKNQQWYFNGEEMKTNYNNNCLDINLDSNNVYMHNCHAGANQKFYMENVVNGLDHDEVNDEIHQEEVEQRDCKSWCYSKKHQDKAWAGKKCAWKACAGCQEC